MASGGSVRARVLARPAVLMLIVLVLVVLGTVRRYGVTWDEESGKSYSMELKDFYLSGGQVQLALTDEYMRFYGGFYEICAAIGEAVFPLGMYESRHLVIALFGLVGIVFAYRLGALLGGQTAGLAAATFLTLTPLYYGHMFNNPKDIPFAATYLAAVYYIVAVRRHFWDLPRSLTVKASVAIGLTLAIRIGGVILFGLLAGAVALAYGARLWERHGSKQPVGWAGGLRPLLKVAPIPVLAWAVMCLFWPYALVSPFRHPLEAWHTFSKYSWSGTVLFAGRLINSHDLPRSYVPTWLALTLPDFLLFALIIAFVGAVLGRPRCLWRLKDPDWLILVAASVGPVALVVVQRTVIYDGIRHLLFAIVPFVVLVGVSVSALREEASRVWLRWAIALPVGWGMVLGLADMVSLHPYQSVYFNRLVAGGLPGAAGRFETDYWGSSLKEAVEWVMRNVKPPAGSRLRVGNPSASFLTGYYVEHSTRAPGRFVNVETADARRGDVDFFITTTRDGNDKRFPDKPVFHRVERQGVPLAVVIGVMGRSEPAEGTAPASASQLPPLELLPPTALGPSAGHAPWYMVPQAAHVVGYRGAVWRTDLVIINRQKHPLGVAAQFLPTGKDNSSGPVVITNLAAGQVLSVPDILALPRFRAAGNFGALLLYATGNAGECEAGACDFFVLARTFNAVTRSDRLRVEEWMGGVGPSAALRPGDKAVFSHVTRSSVSKASVGVASWSKLPVRVRYEVFEAGGREIEKRELELPRFGHVHVLLEAEVNDGRVEVEVVGHDGGAMVIPYVSMVDGRTGLSSHVLPDAMPSRAVPKGWRPPMPEPR